ncbi:MAG: cell division protein FtsQ/DivIB [Actinomycetota bacterium]
MTRSKRRRIFTGAAVALAALGAIWVMFWSPVLDLREVRVLGARYTETEDIVSAAGLDRSGRNILLLSTSDIAEDVERLPWIHEAKVDRMLPGTVRVRVEERRPALTLSLESSRWTIDLHGNVLQEGVVDRKLPVLAGVEVGDLESGVRLQTEEAVDAVNAYRSLAGPIRARVVAIFAPTIERITFTLSDGSSIRFGAAEHLAAKNSVLKSLLQKLRREGRTAEYIDVRVPTSPAVSVASPTPPASPTPGAVPSSASSPLPSPSP